MPRATGETGEITGGYPAPAITGSTRKPDGHLRQDILVVVLRPEG
jgi:hypothetical protein